MNTAALKQLASVQMGLSFRSRVESDPRGNVAIIQMRDLREGHKLNSFRGLVRVTMDDVNERHFVQPGDLIFRSRGKTTTTTLIDAETGGNRETQQAVVASPLLRIRVTDDNILPAYLCWFINQPASQEFLHRRATGTAMVLIGKSILDALEIPVPGLAHQKRIVVLAALSHREQQLMAELAEQRKKLIQTTLMQLMTKSRTKLNNQ